MATSTVLSEMTLLNLVPRGSTEWLRQRTTILGHLAADAGQAHRARSGSDTTPVAPHPLPASLAA